MSWLTTKKQFASGFTASTVRNAASHSITMQPRHYSRRFYEAVKSPWPTFADDVDTAIAVIHVSHRITRTLSGPLHAELIYSKEHQKADGSIEHHMRQALAALSPTDIKKGTIVDAAIRQIVEDTIAALGVSDPKNAFADPANHPVMTTKDGTREIPTHKVRINSWEKP